MRKTSGRTPKHLRGALRRFKPDPIFSWSDVPFLPVFDRARNGSLATLISREIHFEKTIHRGGSVFAFQLPRKERSEMFPLSC